MPTLQRSFFLSAVLFLIAAAAFWPGTDGNFIFDDFPNIVHEERVHATSLDPEELADSFRAASDSTLGRPVASVTFAIDHARWGLVAKGYKITNVLMHATTAVVVFLMLMHLLPLAWRAEGRQALPAFVVALLWAIHPLQVSTVLYVVQRMEILAALFVFLAIIAYLRGRAYQIDGKRGWPWLLACPPLVLLGLLAKENAVLFPMYALALEFTLFGFKGSRTAFTWAWKLAYAAGTVVALLAFVFVIVPQYTPAEQFAIRDFNAFERVLTQFRVLPMYVGWIVLPAPTNFHFYYDNFIASRGLLDPATTLAGLVFLLALFGSAIAARRRMPLYALGVFWFFAAHAITSNVLALELVFEHRNYVALLGILLAVADLVHRMPQGEVPRVRQFAVVVVCAGLMLLTLIRSAGWGDPLLLAMEHAENNPESSRASADLGEQYMVRAWRDPESDFYAMAVAEFERGANMPNASPMPEQGLIVMNAKLGRPANPAWWDSVIRKLETRAIGPQELSMITGLLRARQEGLLIDDGRFADAYLVLVNRMQMPLGQYFAFGDHALIYLKDDALADQLFKRAVDHSMDQPDFVVYMVKSLRQAGYEEHARSVADYAREMGLVDIDDAILKPDAPSATAAPER